MWDVLLNSKLQRSILPMFCRTGIFSDVLAENLELSNFECFERHCRNDVSAEQDCIAIRLTTPKRRQQDFDDHLHGAFDLHNFVKW